MARAEWMIYGATGFTGTLVAEEAVRRGHTPVLAGRSAERLKALGQRLGLTTRTVSLDDPAQLAQIAVGVKLVFHCAGPFSQTASPMLRACLKAGAHYLDIAGDVADLENTFPFHDLARERGIALISGCGFDVIPTDCLANYVAAKVKEPLELEIALATAHRAPHVSAGTAHTTLEGIARGGLERRNGKLAVLPLGQGGKMAPFPGGDRYVLPIPWGDLATAFHSTHIANITTYVAVTRLQGLITRMVAPLTSFLMNVPPIRQLAHGIVGRVAKGPDERTRREGRTLIWARVMDVRGQSVEGWLEIPEAYQFTAVAGVRAVEKVLAGGITGALTPAQAFGADFVLEIDGTKRIESLPA